MDNYLQEFELYMKLDKCSGNTIKNYITDVEMMMRNLDKDPMEVNRMDIVNYLNLLEEQKNNAKTVNRKIYAISKFVQFLNEECKKDININTKKLKMKIEKQEYGVNVLTKTDFKRVLNYSIKEGNIVFTTLLMTLFFTGMRISEALGIKLKEINQKEILVVGKGRKQRYVPIADELRKQFKQYISERGESKQEYLFLNKEKGTRLTPWMCNYWFRKYAGYTKVELKRAHCHNVRHLFCYICINERGMSIDEVAQIVGHADINMTKIYTKKTRKQLIDDVKEFKLD